MIVDVAAERAVLAGLCQYGANLYVDVDVFLNENVFSVESNKVLYNCLFYLFNKNNTNVIDISSILSAAQELGYDHLVKQQREKEFIRALFNHSVHQENVEGFAKKLAKLNLIRLAEQENKKCHTEIMRLDGSESVYELMSIVEAPSLALMSNLTADSSEEPVLLGENIDAYLDHLKSNPTDMLGIPTGYKQLDYYNGGGCLRKSISIIAARPKTGKSFLADNIGINVSRRNIPVLNLDTEMDHARHNNRIMSILSGIPLNLLKTGKYQFDPKYAKAAKDAAEEYKKIPYYYKSIAGKNLEEVLPIIRRWISKKVGYDSTGRVNDCLIIYDYLKLMTSDKLGDHMKEYQVLGFMMTALHNFVYKYDVPCLAFVQINRDGINRETSDIISQSDRILWLCSNMSVYKRKSPEEIEEDGAENGTHKLIPLASRDGPELEDGNYINLFRKNSGLIYEGKTKFQLINEAKEKELELKDYELGETQIPF